MTPATKSRVKYLNNAVRVPVPLTDPREANIQAAIVSLLQWRGWAVVETSQVSAVIRMVGMTDLLAFKKIGAATVTLLIEVKTKKGKLRASQVEFHTLIKAHLSPTLHYMVARSIDDVMVALDGIDADLMEVTA